MREIRQIAALLLVSLCLAGCGEMIDRLEDVVEGRKHRANTETDSSRLAEQSEETFPGSTASQQESAPARFDEAAFETLAERFKAAHEARDVEAIRALAYAGSPPIDDSYFDMTRGDFGSPIKRIYFKEAGARDNEPTDRDGVPYKPVLPVVGHIVIEFAPGGGPEYVIAGQRVHRTSTSYPIGYKDGTYYICYRVPAQ
ncbi:MAG TPA: hypothetical protein V6D08_01880 [Candidatus Obscuribacterales bacterium]